MGFLKSVGTYVLSVKVFLGPIFFSKNQNW